MFVYLSKLSSTEFDLESNWNFLNGKSRSEIPISLQIFLNEIRFRIKLETFWRKKAGQTFLYLRKLSNKIRFRMKLKFSE